MEREIAELPISVPKMRGERGGRTRLRHCGRARLVEVAHNVRDEARMVLEDLVPARSVGDVLRVLQDELHGPLSQSVGIIDVGDDEKLASIVVGERLHKAAFTMTLQLVQPKCRESWDNTNAASLFLSKEAERCTHLYLSAAMSRSEARSLMSGEHRPE